eukprot:CAMPEP_0176499664 /NCGR_PEP_ID=MMETSP0200_2-20121128/13060_1 /TAXON_ID=947934 /ORGANISM="Chaetoceros sp., Strain GSL56" /LENGTH=578 /DNA_ID=CAMNT_0017898123 /DNA_START=72 /DNA_END=1809 /DNA_ORIENTATION=-
MSAASWIRVANGFRLVAHAASTILTHEGANGVTLLTRHSVDLAKNARTAAKAAGVTFPSQMPDGIRHNIKGVELHKNMAMVANEKNETLSTLQVDNAISEPEPSLPLDSSSTSNDGVQQFNTKEIDNDNSQIKSHDYDLSLGSNPVSLKEGRAVPSTRIGRAVGFASLGIGIAAGTIVEAASRILSTQSSSSGSVIANDANAERLAKTLCRMRGAALKLGQMLSIQDETLLPSTLSRALEQVRQGADAMPIYQLHKQLKAELGEDWRSKFESFEELPFAAASIGQVHRATILDNGVLKNVVVKVQYPGVADSIESDLRNLTMLVKMSGFAPKGLFIDRVIEVGREELSVECDYIREARNQERLQDLIHGDVHLAKAKFRVPSVVTSHSTRSILTTEFCPGGTIDKVSLFDDSTVGKFPYDVGSGATYLIDFGSAREYSKSFVDGYLRIVWACANNDTETLMAQSHKMGFLTGQENDIMIDAHIKSGFTLGEPFATDDIYDFKSSGITGRISDHGSAFLRHRLTPPPEEVYTLHRKLAGAFNLCIKIGAKIKCRDLLEDVIRNHIFEDGQPHPLHMVKN